MTMKQGDTKDSTKAVMSGACAFEETQPAIPEVTSSSKEDSPTDGGWGWVVCAGVFVVNFLTVGQHNSAGVVYVAMMDEYSTPRGETAWVTSLASSMNYLFAAMGTALAERYGSRVVVIVGSFVSAAGLLTSSFSTTLQPLFVTYGVIWGLGSSLGLFPSLVILTKYFKKRLSFASGIALAGAASGGLVYGPLIQMLSSEFGISVTFQILSSLQILMFLSALTFVPLAGTNVRQRNTAVFDLQVFKNKSYVIWVIAHCTFMVVFLVPFVHLVRFAEDKGVSKSNASLLTGFMSVGGIIGSLLFGVLCDYPHFKRLIVCPTAVLLMGLICAVVTKATKYEWIIVCAFFFGFWDGCYEMLIPGTTLEIVGVQMVGYAIGALYCFMAFPKTLGPPIAGWIFDISNSYSVSFFVTGGVAASAAVIMSTINCVKPSYEPDEEIARLLPSPEFEKSGSRKRLTYTFTEPCSS